MTNMERYNLYVTDYESKALEEKDEHVKAFWEGVVFGMELAKIVLTKGEEND